MRLRRSASKRLDFLGEVLKGTAPERATWSREVAAAEKEGRYEERVGELTQIGPGPKGLRVSLAPHDGDTAMNLDVTGVVLATGFVKDYAAQPLLRRLVQLYDVPVVRGRIRLLTNCGIPPLDRPDSRLCLLGLNGNTVVPNGDTISGLKYMARRFVGDVRRAERQRRRSLPSRWAMQSRLARRTARRLRSVDKAKQLA